MIERMKNKVLSKFNKNEDFSFEKNEVNISKFEYLELLRSIEKFQRQQESLEKENIFEKTTFESDVKKSVALYEQGQVRDAYVLLKKYESYIKESNMKESFINPSQSFYRKNWAKFIVMDIAILLLFLGAIGGTEFITEGRKHNIVPNNMVLVDQVPAEDVNAKILPEDIVSLDKVGPPLLLFPEIGDEILITVYEQAKAKNSKITESDILYVASKDYFVKALDKHNELDKKFKNMSDTSKALLKDEITKQKEFLMKSMVEMVNIGASERILNAEMEDKLKSLSE